MYQPISFNVIRQALEWHGFPAPTLRQLSYSPVNEDGITSAEYLASWGYSLIDVHYMGKSGFVHHREEDIYRDLKACFMDDIQVQNVGIDFANRRYTALLYVMVDQTVTYWEQLSGISI